MADTGPSPLFRRFSAERVKTALRDTPVVMVNGPRQSGKTTLVRQFIAADRAYITLDDETVLEAARGDPTGLVRELDRAVIDEVQRVPELLRAIKRSVDEDRRPGRFLLTGSANVLTLPQVSESLAGRMEVVSLLPLSRAEVHGGKPKFLKNAFAGELVKPPETMIGDELLRTVLTGGYPEMLKRKDALRRQTWAREYVKAIVQRDVRDVADVEKLDQLPRLLRALAHHAGQLTNFTQIGGQLGLDDKTTRKYVAVLEQLFLVHRIEPWFRNQLKRLVKTPKLHFLDSGLLATMLGTTPERVAKDRAVLGPILETFTFSEILKQTAWLDEACLLHHYRDKDQDEVDIVVEAHDGRLIGIEVKAAATVNTGDFKALRKLSDVCDDNFKLGVVLYDGENIVPFGRHMFAAPMSCVWG
ncbi:MAG: ATP-binding protein [Betaproteobacteria bacterium]|nr:ATP-binding protein [Betaproteobacteria bacterium]